MLIRITENSQGIEHYFETGQKQGRGMGREELDKRVHLSGDLNAFSLAVKYTNRHKNWKAHYWHLTGSFALEDQNVSEETIRAIHLDMLEYYFCRYDTDKIIHASEIHRPRIQTGALGQQRYVHFHMAVSKYDQETGNQVRMIPYRHSADKAFQSYLALKYNLEDPAKKKRLFKPSAETLATMQTGKDPGTDGPKKNPLHVYRYNLHKLLDGIGSVDEAIEILEKQKDIKSVVFKKLKRKDPATGQLVAGNRYLQIKTSLYPKRGINLRGEGFEELEKLYYTPEELEKRSAQGKYKSRYAPREYRDNKERLTQMEALKTVFEEHRQWWTVKALEPKDKTKPKVPARKIDYSKSEREYAEKFEDRIREQRVYFVIYQNNIQRELIRGFELWEKFNTRFLFHNELGVNIYDRPDKITLRIPDDPETRRKAVTLALSIAQTKGWDLKKMKITGSAAFIKETNQQISEIYRPVDTAKMELPERPKTYLNAVKQLKSDQGEENDQARLPKERIKAIKTQLNTKSVINLAIQKWGLPPNFYTPVDGNKIGDERLKRSMNVIDFLTKTCNQPINVVFPLLDDLLRAQEQDAIEQWLEEAMNGDAQAVPQKNCEPMQDVPQDTKSVPEMENEPPDDQEDSQDADFGRGM